MFGFIVWFDSWADCHSFASEIALEMISILENVMLSKQSLFLAFHKFHNIQGQRGLENPTRGKTTSKEAPEIKLVIVGLVAHGLAERGASSQTCEAIGQLWKTCRLSSTPLHLL